MVKLVDEGKIGKDDALQVGHKDYLILEEFSRSFNHSCNPNAGIRRQSDLVAMRDISSGEEITYDYSTTVGVWDEPADWSMKCICEAKECRHVIGRFTTIPKKILDKYYKGGFLPDFIREEYQDIREEKKDRI